MTPAFTIAVDPARSFIRMRMSGFFKPSDVEAFRIERARSHQKLQCLPNQHFTLLDIRDMAIQSQETVAEFQKILNTAELYSKKFAIVVSTSLCRSQVKRAASGRDIEYFDDAHIAERWLFSI